MDGLIDYAQLGDYTLFSASRNPFKSRDMYRLVVMTPQTRQAACPSLCKGPGTALVHAHTTHPHSRAHMQACSHVSSCGKMWHIYWLFLKIGMVPIVGVQMYCSFMGVDVAKILGSGVHGEHAPWCVLSAA
eukprot:GHVU01025002.1.p1 GENE.GHVU01025002.1~~GHVU01025002.1.p1  ORF type:complete len:131 (+),score=0.81 GHVU01025002.1:127-519(+)